MSPKFCVTIVAITLGMALSSAAPAKGRGHFSLGHIGGIKIGITRLFAPALFDRARVHHRRAQPHQVRNAPVEPQAIQPVTNQRPGEDAAGVGRLFTDPAARGQKAATAALALWHSGRERKDGWWS